MLELVRIHQLNIMLSLSSICGIIALFVFFTKSLPPKRRRALGFLEASATLLLVSDRFAYLYRGDVSTLGFWMVRISNFLVFSLSLTVIYAFNVYLTDLFVNEGGLSTVPKRLKLVETGVVIGEALIILSQFTGLYYTFDEMNRYQRSPSFILCYVIPLLALLIQLSAIIQYCGRLRRGIRVSLLLFSVGPLIASIAQIFTYGLSLTNLSIVGMAVLLYVFALLDMNKALERANRLEIEFLKEEQESMRRLFDQTAKALVNAIDAKDDYTRGHSLRVAEYARKIAERSGKGRQACDEAYYAALLHDVGKIGIPDSIIKKDGRLTEEEQKAVREHPTIGKNILSGIAEFPYLETGAGCHHERYDGTGYPNGLKGEEIPDVARIVAVADAYDTMTSRRRYRDPMPQQAVREELVKGAGAQFDPVYAEIMLQLIDQDVEYRMREDPETVAEEVELGAGGELHCVEYRSRVSEGIPVWSNVLRLRLKSVADEGFDEKTSIPAIILFDSHDGRVHTEERSIRQMRYLEYGELWFDGHTICTDARNMKTKTLPREAPDDQTERKPGEPVEYTVEAARYRDHLRLRITGGRKSFETIVALADSTRYAYIGLTGEHCRISELSVEETEETVGEGDIPRIAGEISYINRLEGDIPNLQVDGTRSAATAGAAVEDGMRLAFHTMSLPTAHLVWHCPYIVLFCADDRRVNGSNYRELALIRLDGETQASGKFAENRLYVEKNAAFQGWDAWKKQNLQGFDCEVLFRRSGDRITTFTENGGISIRNVTAVHRGAGPVYAALTGDQCALTDIRIL